MLNPVVWSLLGLVSTAWVARRHLSSVAAEAAVATSHGAGFLMLSGVYAYGLWASTRHGTLRSWLRWRGLSAVIVLSSLLFAWSKRKTFGHPITPGIADIWGGLQWLVVNPLGHLQAEAWQPEWVLATAGTPHTAMARQSGSRVAS